MADELENDVFPAPQEVVDAHEASETDDMGFPVQQSIEGKSAEARSAVTDIITLEPEEAEALDDPGRMESLNP